MVKRKGDPGRTPKTRAPLMRGSGAGLGREDDLRFGGAGGGDGGLGLGGLEKGGREREGGVSDGRTERESLLSSGDSFLSTCRYYKKKMGSNLIFETKKDQN